MGRVKSAQCFSALVICAALLVPCLVQAQFIHIFEVQDENRAPKSDLFDPSSYKYVSPAQLQKQQEANKLVETATASPTPRPTPPPTARPVQPASAPVPEYRATPPPASNSYASDPIRSNAYSSHVAEQPRVHHSTPAPVPTQPPAASQPVTYMQPISRILANISANEIPAQSEMELRKQIRGQQQSEKRYSRTTTPLRVSAQNQRQYVVSLRIQRYIPHLN